MNNQIDTHSLTQLCHDVLNENWRDGFTVPTRELYPFQWLWDSGFIAIGWSHIDMARARKEIETVLAAQWKNGMLPHIVFHNDTPEKNYFPGADFHGASVSPNVPAHVKTSGITQPAVIGFVLEQLWNSETGPEAHHDFYRRAVEQTFQFHQYLYRDRDPQREGLVYIRHNWESGVDNGAAWDSVWARYSVPEYNLKRKDTSLISEDQRPTKKDYNYYVHLLKVSIECGYDEGLMYEKLPFIVQDPLFNAILVASNESLGRLAEVLDLPQVVAQTRIWNRKTIARMNEKLWDQKQGVYVYYDLKNNSAIPIPGAPGMTPLFAGIPSTAQAQRMKEMMASKAYSGEHNSVFLCPTLPVDHPEFDDRRYWRGPVWININWLIYKGCLRYGFMELANRIRQESLQLVSRYGPFEYFNPMKSAVNDPNAKGFGGVRFSWTVALLLDMMATDLQTNAPAALTPAAS